MQDYANAAKGGRDTPQAVAFLEHELAQCRNVVCTYDCNSYHCKYPPQDTRLAELYFWNLLTAVMCFSWQVSHAFTLPVPSNSGLKFYDQMGSGGRKAFLAHMHLL